MKVAIAWYGAEGESNYRYYSERGHDVTIVTPQLSPQFPVPVGAALITGKDAFDRLNGFDLVVRSASVRPDALVTDGKLWSATNEFFATCPAPIVGVTGTKGKGTTCSLIASILRSSGYTVHLVGNIGVPALDTLSSISSDDIVVYELSSFQLWDCTKSPHVAVVLMIEPDHLDVHADIEEYVLAKSAIAAYQSDDDLCVYHPTNKSSQRIANMSPAVKQRYAVPDDKGVYIEANNFFVQDEAICEVSALQLPGVHNLQNACAALTACLEFTRDYDRMEAGIREFKGLPHRLKFVRTVGGVAYYDDSIATTSGSAIAALQAFDNGKIIILGGSRKGVTYDEVIAACKDVGARVIAIGETGAEILQLCRDNGVPCRHITGGMAAVVEASASEAKEGDTVILSPASASFDQYKNYSDRGEQFVGAVNAL